MSERINVDHAFDPEARQAQAELDAYMDSRPFEDKNGSLHDAETNKFIAKDKFHGGEYDTHYEDSLAETDYSNESLEQLAQRVADARAEGDKTRANDAEAAFFEKFTAYSDKYGWEEEDGSANGPHVDKNAKLGRQTVDDRLARYTEIMYGKEDNEPNTPETSEDIPANTDTPEDIESNEAESAEKTDGKKKKKDGKKKDKASKKGSDNAESTEDESERKPNSIEADIEATKAKLHAAADDMEAEAVAEMNSTDQAKADKILLEPIDEPDLEPVDGDDVVLERIEDDDLEPIDNQLLSNTNVGEGRLAAEVALARQEQGTAYTPRGWRQRLRDLATRSGLKAELNRQGINIAERLGNHKRGKIALGIVGLAAVGFGTAVYLVNRHNGGGMTGNGNFFNDAMNHVQDSMNNSVENAKHIADGDTLQPKNGGGAGGGLEWADFSKAAQNAQPNEGWNRTMLELGIPKDHWADILKDAGPKLNKIGEAYYDKRFNDWGISEPGKLSKRALQIIAAASKRDGFDLAA